MDRFDRIYDLHKLLSSSRYPVSREKIEQELECSRATAKRIIENMRLYLDAPIRYDRSLNGYFYDRKEENHYELPGLWFNASELHALLSVQQLLSSVQPGLFDKQLAPLLSRIDKLLTTQHHSAEDIHTRVRILQIASRSSGEFFQQVAGAVMQRKQLQIKYFNRSRNSSDERRLSPQRLVHYRDNWYLDAWCHEREALRTFSLDAIESARLLEQQAKNIDAQTLEQHYGASYGIFSGEAKYRARLIFDEDIARWVSREQWHPQQQGEFLENGFYQLELPYHNHTELVMDILKYGDKVVVESPDSLKQAVKKQLQAALKRY